MKFKSLYANENNSKIRKLTHRALIEGIPWLRSCLHTLNDGEEIVVITIDINNTTLNAK
jgi:hypothetical protein